MALFVLVMFGPIVLAASIALILRLTLLRRTPTLTARDALLTAIAGGIPLVVTLAPLAGEHALRQWLWPDLGARVASPLLLGIIGVVLLSFPSRARLTHASAQLTPRTVRVFLRPRQPIILTVLIAVAVVLAIAAGSASVNDDMGRRTHFTISLGTTGGSASTEIYGWYYSLPSLGLLAALLIITVLAWLRVPRPAWSDDIDRDTTIRRLRSDNIARIACGAVLLHLSFVFGSLAGTATMMLSMQAESIGTVTLGTPFAAMAPALYVAQAITGIAGIALWLLTVLTGLPMSARERDAAPLA